MTAASSADSTIAFKLRDQFGQSYDARDYRGRVVLVVAAARGGRAVGTAWVETLRGLQDTAVATSAVPIVAVADLRGVPWLLRRIARAQFPDDRRQPVLLDWDGSVARRLELDRERCTVLVVGPDGRVDTRLTPEVVDTAVVRTLLRQGASRGLAADVRLSP